MRRDIDYIVDNYSDTIFRAAYAYLKNVTESEDIVSEVLLKYFSYDKDKFSSDQHLKAWLIRVTINMCKNQLRFSKHDKRFVTENELPTQFSYNDEQYDVSKALDSLDKKYRMVLYLFYFEEYKTEEIAAILRIPKGTVVSRLSRGREKLKIKLNSYDTNAKEMSV